MRKIYLFFAFIFFAVTVNAQQIYIQEPIVNQLGCTSIPDLYAVSVNNFQSSTVQCAMEVEISYTGNALQKGLVAKGSLTGAPIFNLPPGLTRFLPSNINQFFPTRNLQFFDNNLKQINEQSACLPSGQYDICITLYGVDSKGNINLQNQLSKTCYKVTKENNNAIFLISPVNNEKVKMALPVFAWSPVANFSKTSNYIIEIVEVLDGQTAFEAFRQNPIYFSEAGLKSNSFQYQIKARQLTPCINYAWRVGYYEEFGFNNPGFNVLIKPSLYSEIWALTFQCDNTKSTTKSALNASRLIKPVQYATLLSNSGVSFTWSEITPPQSYDITYLLRVVEKPISLTALQAFNSMPPILSTPIVNNVFFYWAESAQFLDKSKTYVWGIIPYNNAQEQIVDNFLIEKNTFSFEANPVTPKDCPLKLQDTRILSQNYNSSTLTWEIKMAKPQDNSEFLSQQVTEVTINGELFYLGPNIGNIEITINYPTIDVASVNTTSNEIILTIKSKTNGKDISNLGNIQFCVQRKYASGEYSCVSQTCTNSILSVKVETQPQLTKMQAMQGFPKLNPDKTVLIKMDIASDVNQFPGWQIRTKQFELLPQDNNVKLEIIAANDNTFTYTVLLKDKTTLQTINLNDVELPINLVAKYKYEFLKRDNSGSLISMSTKDTTRVIPLSEFENSDRPQLTKIQAMQGFPKLNPDKTALIKMDIASNVDQFSGWQIQTKKFELLPKDNSMKLDMVKADDNTFNYTILLKDKVTLNPIELVDQKLPIELIAKYEYELLKRDDAGGLLSVALLDTVALIPLSDFFKEECILTISKLRLPNPYEYVSNATYSHPDKGKVSKYWKLQLNQDTKVNKKTNTALPKYYQGAKKVEFTTVMSNVPLTFIEAKADGPFGGSFYIIDPDWAAIGEDGNNPDKAYWEVKICMTIPLYKDAKGNETDFRKLPVECEATECIIIKHNEKLLETAKEEENKCELEITNFTIANSEPIFREDNVPNNEHPDQYLKDFFQYNFRTNTNLNEINAANNNIYSANEIISFEILESNIGLAHYDMGGANAHALQPIWETSSFFGKNKVFYKAKVCYTVEFYEGDALYCVDNKCKDISYQGKSVQNMLSNSCLLAADFTFKKNNELVTFYPTLENHIPDSSYSYQWIFSDGQTTTGDTTINLYTSLDNAWAKLIVTGRDENGKWCVSDTIKKNLKVIPDCDFQACYTPCGSLISSLKVDDEVNLCGQLIMKISSVSGSGAGYTGKGTVRIPWLLSDIEVEFTDIKVNTSMEFCSGEINAVKYDNTPQLPQQLAINAGVAITENQIQAVNNFVNDINVKQIPDDAVIDAAQDAVNTLRVPIGFTNFDPQSQDTLNKTNFTLAIGAITFKPGQNYIRAYAGVTLNDPDIGSGAQQLLFQSDNFFFNAAKPIYNTGDPLDLKFKIISPTTIRYGTNNGDPIYLTFNDDSKKDTWGGTQLSLESDCNTPYRFCLKADIDIEMPRTWLVPLDDNDPTKVKANAKIEMCDFKDIITQISLPKCKLPNTAGCELEVQQLTWDQSSTRNADSFAFPANYNQTGISEDLNEFKGFFLNSAQLILPEGLVKNDNSRIEVNLNNWIFHKGFGVTGSVVIKPNISFPDMNVSDLGASIDSFRMEWVNSSLKQAYLKGEITLPVADYSANDPEKSMNKLVYKAMFGSYPTGTIDNGILFQVSPKNGLKSDFFGKGTLDIKPTSNLSVSFTSSATSIDFVMDGKIDWPNKQVGPINLDMELGFEQIKLNYSKPRGGDRGTFLFDHGVWSFASPPKKMNGFPITIRNFKSVTEQAVGNDIFVGGIGMDIIINLNEKFGGETTVNILGAIRKTPGNSNRMRSRFKEVEIERVKVYADLAAVKIDGELELFDEHPMMGNGFSADISVKIKAIDVLATAKVMVGNTNYNNGNERYRYFKVECLVLLTPGVPIAPGFAIRGGGVGVYHNMDASLPNISALPTSSNTSFPGSQFTPKKGGWGFGFKGIGSTIPKEEGLNGDLGLTAHFTTSGGISHVSMTAQIWVGCSISDRMLGDNTKAILSGSVIATYDFINKNFDLDGELRIDRDPISGNVVLDVNANFLTGRWYFKLGTQLNPNTLNVSILGVDMETKNYFMFGNDIPQPSPFSEWARTRYLGVFGPDNSLERAQTEINSSSGSNLNVSTDQTVRNGAGFAFGIGAGVKFEKRVILNAENEEKKWYKPWEYILEWVPCDIGATFDLDAGMEINAALMKYPGYSCGGYPQVGINGWRASGSVIGWASVDIGAEICGLDRPLLGIGVGGWLYGKFPKPVYLAGGLDYYFKIVGFKMDGSFDFEYGDECAGGSVITASNAPVVQQDAVENQRAQLIRELTPTNNTQGFEITKPTTGKYGFIPDQEFTVTEQQADGTGKVRTFKAFYFADLWSLDPVKGRKYFPLQEKVNILNEYEYFIKNSPTSNAQSNSNQGINQSKAINQAKQTILNMDNSQNFSQLSEQQLAELNRQQVRNPPSNQEQTETDDYGPYRAEPNLINTLEKQTNYEFNAYGSLLEKKGDLGSLRIATTTVAEAYNYFNSLPFGLEKILMLGYLNKQDPSSLWGGWQVAKNNSNQPILEKKTVNFKTQDRSTVEQLNFMNNTTVIAPSPSSSAVNPINP